MSNSYPVEPFSLAPTALSYTIVTDYAWSSSIGSASGRFLLPRQLPLLNPCQLLILKQLLQSPTATQCQFVLGFAHWAQTNPGVGNCHNNEAVRLPAALFSQLKTASSSTTVTTSAWHSSTGPRSGKLWLLCLSHSRNFHHLRILKQRLTASSSSDLPTGCSNTPTRAPATPMSSIWRMAPSSQPRTASSSTTVATNAWDTSTGSTYGKDWRRLTTINREYSLSLRQRPVQTSCTQVHQKWRRGYPYVHAKASRSSAYTHSADRV